MNNTKGERMEALRPLKTVVVSSDLIHRIAMQLKQFGFNNHITLVKSRIVILFKELEIITTSGNVLQYGEKITEVQYMEIRKNIRYNNIAAIRVRSNSGDIVTYNQNELDAMYGFEVANHHDITIEYLKSMLFDILHNNNELDRLCNRNPLLEKSINIYEVLSIGSSQCLSDDDVDAITVFLKRVSLFDLDGRLAYIRSISNKYPFNPKKFELSNFSITLSVYEDIRTIRFNEMNADNGKMIVDADSAPINPKLNTIWNDTCFGRTYVWVLIDNVPTWKDISEQGRREYE